MKKNSNFAAYVFFVIFPLKHKHENHYFLWFPLIQRIAVENTAQQR